MPGSVSAEDPPSRGACLTFTIDNILNLKQRGGKESDASEKRRGKRCAEGLPGWDVRRGSDSSPEETGRGGLTHAAWGAKYSI